MVIVDNGVVRLASHEHHPPSPSPPPRDLRHTTLPRFPRHARARDARDANDPRDDDACSSLRAQDELDAVKWAGKDPYARAGLFGAPATAVAAAPEADADAAAGSSSILRFTDLDVNGRHCYDRGSVADQVGRGAGGGSERDSMRRSGAVWSCVHMCTPAREGGSKRRAPSLSRAPACAFPLARPRVCRPLLPSVASRLATHLAPRRSMCCVQTTVVCRLSCRGCPSIPNANTCCAVCPTPTRVVLSSVRTRARARARAHTRACVFLRVISTAGLCGDWQPDPVMARMVELGLVDLPEREVDMIILSDDKENKEQNPEWPLERVTVHTRDPRLVSNIAPSLQGRYEREMIEDTDSLYREGVIAED